MHKLFRCPRKNILKQSLANCWESLRPPQPLGTRRVQPSERSQSFALGVSALALSLSSFLKILPDGFLGITSRNTMPPSNLLALDTRSASQDLIFSAISGVAFSGVWGTMYARGSSPPSLCWSALSASVEGQKTYWLTPMTAAS